MYLRKMGSDDQTGKGFYDIYVADETEAQSVPVDDLAPGSKLYAAQDATLYVLDKEHGNWYDTDGNKLQADGGEVDTTLTLTNCTGSGQAYCNRDFAVTLAAADGYTLPASVTITIGGTAATAGTDYTYEKGTVSIQAEQVLGAITISAEGVADES